MNILFIGDIVGKIGRQTVARLLPKIKKEYAVDIVVANAENSAHGSGVTEAVIKELRKTGIDWMTTGDHAFKRRKQLEVFEKYNIIRPANYPLNSPGKGHVLIPFKDKNILFINLIGRTFMKMSYDCPFRKLDEILANNSLRKKNISAIIIDIHAEATSEKIAIGHHANGRVSAVLGTHTHIATADAKITDKGLAYITDVGMAGADNGCLGLDKKNILKTFLTQIKYPHEIPIKGSAIFNSVLLEIDEKTKKSKKIKPITKFIDI